MSRKPVTGTLAGVPFLFESDADDLTEYSRSHLAPLLSEVPETPTICARLRWHDGQPPESIRKVAPAALRIDRDLYHYGNTLHWFRVDDLRDLFLRLTWDGARLEIEADFYFRLGNSRLSDTIRRVRQWQRRDVMRRRRFPTILAYLVYYPCWWWLEHMQGRHPLHAGAALMNDQVVLLAGASGIGKSTLTVALGAEKGARLLSDSFVLHHATQVWAVHEPILLDRFSQDWLGTRAGVLEAIPHSYGLHRGGYRVAPSHLADRGRAALLLFPRRGAPSMVRQLDDREARHRLSSGDLLINDLRRYFAYAAVLEQLLPSGLMLQRETQLDELASAVPSFELVLSEDVTCDRAVAMVGDLLNRHAEPALQRS